MTAGSLFGAAIGFGVACQGIALVAVDSYMHARRRARELVGLVVELQTDLNIERARLRAALDREVEARVQAAQHRRGDRMVN